MSPAFLFFCFFSEGFLPTLLFLTPKPFNFGLSSIFSFLLMMSTFSKSGLPTRCVFLPGGLGGLDFFSMDKSSVKAIVWAPSNYLDNSFTFCLTGKANRVEVFLLFAELLLPLSLFLLLDLFLLNDSLLLPSLDLSLDSFQGTFFFPGIPALPIQSDLRPLISFTELILPLLGHCNFLVVVLL